MTMALVAVLSSTPPPSKIHTDGNLDATKLPATLSTSDLIYLKQSYNENLIFTNLTSPKGKFDGSEKIFLVDFVENVESSDEKLFPDLSDEPRDGKSGSLDNQDEFQTSIVPVSSTPSWREPLKAIKINATSYYEKITLQKSSILFLLFIGNWIYLIKIEIMLGCGF